MRLRLIGLVSLLLIQSAHAQSFNCRYARTPDEVAICEDARLSALVQFQRTLFDEGPCGIC
jgi:uncharacterized protein